jgi:hypothetical protein
VARVEEVTMAIETKRELPETVANERPFAHLRATAEERERIASARPPFDIALWQRDTVSPAPEEIVDLEEFLQEREAMRRYSLEHERKRSAESGE